MSYIAEGIVVKLQHIWYYVNMRALRDLGIGEVSNDILTLVMLLRPPVNIKTKNFLGDWYPKSICILNKRIESSFNEMLLTVKVSKDIQVSAIVLVSSNVIVFVHGLSFIFKAILYS